MNVDDEDARQNTMCDEHKYWIQSKFLFPCDYNTRILIIAEQKQGEDLLSSSD